MLNALSVDKNFNETSEILKMNFTRSSFFSVNLIFEPTSKMIVGAHCLCGRKVEASVRECLVF